MKSRRLFSRVLVVTALSTLVLGTARAQKQTTIGTPFQSNGNSFFENVGTGFNFSLRGAPIGPNARGVVGLGPGLQLQPNIQFQQGNNQPGVPFGLQPNPGNAATLGYAIATPNFTARFGLSAAQGATLNNSSTTASVTSLNGTQGTISDTTQRPFVISVVPVVGGFMPGVIGFDMGSAVPQSSLAEPIYTTALQEKLDRMRSGATSGARSPLPGGGGTSVTGLTLTTAGGPNDGIAGKLQAARESTAGQAAESLHDIQSQQAAADAELASELADLLDKAREAEAAGKKTVARIYYQQAARRVTGSQLLELQAKIRELGQK